MLKARVVAALVPLLVPDPALAGPPALNGGQARIVVVSLGECCPEEAWIEAESSVREEFTALDFNVEIVSGTAISEQDRRVELVEMAKEHGAVCALRIVRSHVGAGSVELWIVDRITGKTVLRSLPVPPVADREAASIVALRAVELLRASLFELHAPEPPPGEAAPPGPAVELAGDVKPGPSGPVGLRTGLSVLGSPGGAGALGSVGWAVSWTFLRPLSVEVEGLVTFAGRDVASGSGASTFDSAAVRAWILWTFINRGIVRPAIGAGAGVLVSWTKGLRSDVHLVTTDRVATGYAGITAQLALALSRRVWLRAGVNLGGSIPTTRILFADEVVATFGLPLVEGYVCLEIRIP